MRKQTAELRRYRRLTSAGRLSLATSKRSISSSFSVSTGADELSELSEEDADWRDSLLSDPLDEDPDALAEEGSAPDPEILAARRAQQRARDEERIQLDLAKHRELLVDSQRMNQSLKRCLGWTEDLIKEGKKALVHRVRVSDVRLGGRVLDDDDSGAGEQRHGLLSPAFEKTEEEVTWDVVPDRGSHEKEEPQIVENRDLDGSPGSGILRNASLLLQLAKVGAG